MPVCCSHQRPKIPLQIYASTCTLVFAVWLSVEFWYFRTECTVVAWKSCGPSSRTTIATALNFCYIRVLEILFICCPSEASSPSSPQTPCPFGKGMRSVTIGAVHHSAWRSKFDLKQAVAWRFQTLFKENRFK